MVLACLAACHKDKEMDVKEAVVSNEEMTVTETQACFSWQVDFAGQFQTGVEVSQSENMADLRRVEASKEEDKFVAVVDSLTEGTNYYYRFVVWNKFGSSEQSLGNFKTMETPPTPGQDTTYFEITVSVNLPEGGTATGGGRFAEGDTCRVIATANAGYIFVNWAENESQVSADAEYSFAVTGNRSLVANFTLQEYTITATADPIEGGVVEGSGSYNYGDECFLTATANDEYKFESWTENGEIVSEEAHYSFTVTADRDLVANFSILPPNTCYIAASTEPDNGGTVLGGGTYNEGDQCTLTANANTDDGFQFDYWTRNGTTIIEPYTFTFTVTESVTFVAHFKLKQYWIGTSVEPTGSGSVSGGNQYYNHGDQCNLMANAYNNAQYQFDYWTKNGTSYPGGSTITFTMTETATFTAHFQIKSYTINVSTNPNNGGTVDGGGTYEYGQSCTVRATKADGYDFVNWTENGNVVSSEASYTFNVMDNCDLVANFTAKSYTVNVSANPVVGGTVTGGGSYHYGDNCAVNATANGGYNFINWTENGNVVSLEANYTFNVMDDCNLVANFSTQGPLGWAEGVSISVLTSDGHSPEGTVVSFLNLNSQEQQNYPMSPITIDQTGFYMWDTFRRGIYQVTVSKSGYETFVDEVGIWEDYYSMSYTLISNTILVFAEYYPDSLDPDSPYVKVFWEGTGASSYIIYRANCDGSNAIVIAENVTGSEYIDTDWMEIGPGEYKYGVKTTTGSEVFWSNCLGK